MSLRKAVNNKCKECSYDNLDVGTWRQQVERCIDTTCPLHPVRPVSSSNRGKTVPKKEV